MNSALDPVLDRATSEPEPEQAILNLKVCDPAAGSGHFLVAAAHRIARRLAAVRSGDEEPAPGEVTFALRAVVSHCLYGVDINEMAVELCKVSLWMTAMAPGRPLSFLDHRIRCGNSLLGTMPALMAKGIPDEAFKPITGDDRETCAQLKNQNRRERRSGMGDLFRQGESSWSRLCRLSDAVTRMSSIGDADITDVQEQAAVYVSVVESEECRQSHLLANAWCAAFIWKKHDDPDLPYPVTEAVFRRLQESPDKCSEWMRQEIQRLAKQHLFFHWHIEFPNIFQPPAPDGQPDNKQMGWCGGFDVMLGNPPWDVSQLNETEYFAVRDPGIAALPGAKRKKAITQIEHENPQLWGFYQTEKRRFEATNQLIRFSGRYPLTAVGKLNSYALFAESFFRLIAPRGRAGFIVPTGIATDDSTKAFFSAIAESGHLTSLFDFENRNGIFAAVHRSFKFCLLTLGDVESAEFVFFALDTAHLSDQHRRFSLTPGDFRLLNPNTRTCPIFRSVKDAELTKNIYRTVPVLIEDGPPAANPWRITFRQGLFNMTSDSGLFVKPLTLRRMDPALLMETDPPVGALGKTDPIDMTDPVCAELPSLHWTGR